MTIETIYENLIANNKIEDAYEYMHNDEMKKKISYFINSEYITTGLSEEELQEISLIIKVAQYLYTYSDMDTGLTDSQYDVLYEKMINGGGKEIISVAKNIEETCHHKFPSFRGTLDKVYYLGVSNEEVVNKSRRSLDQWIETTERELFNITGKHIDIHNAEIYVFPKFDGISCIFEFDDMGNVTRALTRGYTENNTATNIIKMFPKFEYIMGDARVTDEYALKTEIMVPNDKLDKFNETYGTNYKNTRSIAAGILNSNEYDKTKCKLLKPIPLRYGDNDNMFVAEEAFKDYPHLSTTLDDREGIYNFAQSLYVTMPKFRCDGAVIKLKDERLCQMLGIKNDRVKSEVAYKFTEVRTKSIIRSIEYQLGLFNNITPVAIFDPVKLKGNTITKSSLGSIGRLKEMKLAPEDEIIVNYDIIPVVTINDSCKRSGKPAFKIIDTCPSCGEELEPKIPGSDELVCSNKECVNYIIGKIINYATKLRIMNLSYSTLQTLFHMDFITSLPDIYELYMSKSELEKIDGFGKKRVATLLDSIDEHRELMSYEFFGALGIENASTKTFKKVLSIFTWQELFDFVNKCNTYEICSILKTVEGLGNKTALAIASGLVDNSKVLQEFSRLILLDKFKLINYNPSSDTPEFTVCFTKIRNSEIEDEIRKHHGAVVDTVNKDTTYLVVKDEAVDSSKVNKAKKHGVRIVTLDEMKKILSEM